MRLRSSAAATSQRKRCVHPSRRDAARASAAAARASEASSTARAGVAVVAAGADAAVSVVAVGGAVAVTDVGAGVVAGAIAGTTAVVAASSDAAFWGASIGLRDVDGRALTVVVDDGGTCWSDFGSGIGSESGGADGCCCIRQG